MKDRENTSKMFRLAGSQGFRDEKVTPTPPADEMENFFSDLEVPEPSGADKTPAPVTEEAVKIGPAPGEQTIKSVTAKYAEDRSDTAGFKAAGERIRVVLPDDSSDPERVARLTQLGLAAIKAIEATRSHSDKPKKVK